MRRIGILLGILLLLGASSEASDKGKQWTNRAIPEASKDEVRKVVTGANSFAIDLYGALAAGTGNFFFSPISVSEALAMVYAGAAGETAAEMARMLSFPLDDPKFHASNGLLLASLNHGADAGLYDIRVANRLWGRKGYGFLEPFLKTLRESYAAPLETVDIAGNPSAAKKTINAWIAEQTSGRIPNAVQTISPADRLVLTNTIYFHGRWMNPFDAKRTRDLPFHTTREDSVVVPMMFRHGTYEMYQGEGLKFLELPYAGEDLNMVIVLPDAIDGLAAIEARLSKDNLRSWLRSTSEAEVDVYLPRFRMTDDFDLAATLAGMGMPTLFESGADLSGMSDERGLFVSHVFHSTFVDVNEEGTEAAAATGMTLLAEAEIAAPPVFRADHPFLFFIRDKWTGVILFMGRVADPLAG